MSNEDRTAEQRTSTTARQPVPLHQRLLARTGPENPKNPESVMIEVDPGAAEYWDAPGGSRVIQLTNLVRAKPTGSRIEGDKPQVDLS